MTHVHHTIDYVEIDVADLEQAKAFYAAAFAWTFNDYGPTYAGIRWTDGEGEVGGLNAAAGSTTPTTPTGPTGPTGPTTPTRGGALVLLWSGDLDATAAAVVAAGGAVVNGPYDFPGGRRFHFTDPSGNELGVWGA